MGKAPPRFVAGQSALDGLLRDLKQLVCSHCRKAGALIGHGFLRGYAERGPEVVVRGRRFFCSNRGRRPGCGRTSSVLLQTLIPGFIVRTLSLWCFLNAVLVAGLTRRAAWLREMGGAMSLSCAYRLWQSFERAQSALRSGLSRETPAPPSAAREPLAQLVAHLILVVGSAPPDPLATYQHRVQRSVL